MFDAERQRLLDLFKEKRAELVPLQKKHDKINKEIIHIEKEFDRVIEFNRRHKIEDFNIEDLQTPSEEQLVLRKMYASKLKEKLAELNIIVNQLNYKYNMKLPDILRAFGIND